MEGFNTYLPSQRLGNKKKRNLWHYSCENRAERGGSEREVCVKGSAISRAGGDEKGQIMGIVTWCLHVPKESLKECDDAFEDR